MDRRLGIAQAGPDKVPAGAGRKIKVKQNHCFLLSLALGLRSLEPHFLHLSAFLGLVA